LRHLILGLTLLAAPSLFAQSKPRLVDLGHPLSDQDPTWSGKKAFSRSETRGEGFAMGSFSADEHFGTHLDAPVHAGGTWTTDQIPLDRYLRPAVRIDVRAAVAKDEDYRLTLDDIRSFEAREGLIPEGSVVLVATGWDDRWPDGVRYMNERGGVKHFPGLSVESAAFLVNERKVVGIGIDTPSVDYGPSAKFEVHHTTMPRNIYHVENAKGLAGLPAKGFSILIAPINLSGGSGGPTRFFAVFEK